MEQENEVTGNGCEELMRKGNTLLEEACAKYTAEGYESARYIFESAAIIFTEIIELDPMNTEAYYSRGVAMMHVGNKHAELDYNKAIELGYREPLVYIYKGIVLMYEERLEEAIEDFSVAIEIDDKDGKIFHMRARAKEKLGRYEDAISDYSRAIALEPLDKYSYIERRNLREKLGDKEGAASDTERVAQLEPLIAFMWKWKFDVRLG